MAVYDSESKAEKGNRMRYGAKNVEECGKYVFQMEHNLKEHTSTHVTQ